MTPTIAVPTVATSAAVIAACRLVLEMMVVERAFPFHCKLAEEKVRPGNRQRKACASCNHRVRIQLPLTVGTGLLIGERQRSRGASTRRRIRDPHRGRARCGDVRRSDVCLQKLVLETKVVARALPLHCTVEEEMKLDPVTVNVKAAPLAVVRTGIQGSRCE